MLLFLKPHSLYLIPALSFSFPEIADFFCQAIKVTGGGGVKQRRSNAFWSYLCRWLLTAESYLLSASLTHSLSPSLPPSLPLQSALHWEKHVEENCKCAELSECVHPECVSGRSGSNAGEGIGIIRGSACVAPLSVYRMCASVHVCVCTLQCWAGKVAALPPHSLGLCSGSGQRCISGKRGVKSGLQSGMKGRSCWESGTVRSLCNSGCLSKLNRGQYSYS